MNVLVTGAKGFVGKNLIPMLYSMSEEKALTIFEYGRETDKELLELYCKNADFVFHLAGVNRPENEEAFMRENVGFTKELLFFLQKYNNTCPIVFASSIQAKMDNPYGRSKKMAEDLVFAHCKEMGAKSYVYRFPNIFGKMRFVLTLSVEVV